RGRVRHRHLPRRRPGSAAPDAPPSRGDSVPPGLPEPALPDRSGPRHDPLSSRGHADRLPRQVLPGDDSCGAQGRSEGGELSARERIQYRERISENRESYILKPKLDPPHSTFDRTTPPALRSSLFPLQFHSSPSAAFGSRRRTASCKTAI